MAQAHRLTKVEWVLRLARKSPLAAEWGRSDVVNPAFGPGAATVSASKAWNGQLEVRNGGLQNGTRPTPASVGRQPSTPGRRSPGASEMA